jgi:hypothetical protein
MCFYYDLFIIIMSLSTISYLYQQIIQNEEMCEKCLSICGLLPIGQTCTKIKNQTIFNGCELKKILKKIIPWSNQNTYTKVHNS